MALACSLAWLGVLWLGDWVDRTERPLANIVGLRIGHLPRFFSTVMLLAAGQLAFINLWYRSRSRKDFNGSYKVWFYTAVGWLTLCAFTATGSHWTVADVLLGGRPIAVWNGRLMLWLIPGAIVVTALYRLLGREVRDCRLSLWLLRCSAGAAAAAAAVLLLGPFAFSPRWQLLLEVGGSTAWHLLLALSMLVHARHVIHVSNEPPQSPLPSWKWRLPKLGWNLPVRRANSPTSADGPATGKAKRSTSSARGRSTSKERSAARPRPVSKPDQAPAEGEETSLVGDDEREDVPVHSRSGGSQSIRQTPLAGGAKSSPPSGATAAGVTPRVDPPQSASRRPHLTASPLHRSTDPAEYDEDEEDDEETFEHRPLSKKERRRLRKLQQHSSHR